MVYSGRPRGQKRKFGRYASYLGGNGDEVIFGIAFYSSGNLTVAGTTTSNNLPASASPVQRKPGGGRAAFAAKFNPPELIDCTYIEGTGHDETYNLAVDEAGVDPEVHYAGLQND